MTTPGTEVSFRRDVLRTFATASGDNSPLHSDEHYARRTPFGDTIIHGSCALLAVLPRATAATTAPLRLTAIFRQALFPERTYRVDATPRGDDWRLELLADGTSMMVASLTPHAVPLSLGPPVATERAMRAHSATPTARDLMAGDPVHGVYAPDTTALVALAQSHSGGREIGPALAASLGWISYLAGMELPGRDSMCRRIDLTINQHIDVEATLTYEASVEMFDERTRMLRVVGSLFRSTASIASCSLGIHWREPPPGYER